MNKFDFALILTCTINPVNIPNLVRNDPNMRFEDYKNLLIFGLIIQESIKLFLLKIVISILIILKILQRIKINKLSFFRMTLIIHLTKISEKDLANIFVLRKFLKNRL